MMTRLLLAVVLLVGCAGAEGDPSVVWEEQAQAIAEGRDPSLLVRASGMLAMAYAGPREHGGREVFYRASHDQGQAFSPPVAVSRSGGRVVSHGESAVTLRESPRGQLFVAWIQGRELHVARSVDFGHSFQASVGVSPAAHRAAFPSLEVGPSGALHLVWLESSLGAPSLYSSRSIDSGQTFSPPVRIAEGVCPCCRPSIAFSGVGQIMVAWRHVFDADERSTVVAASTNGGRAWRSPERVAGDSWRIRGCPHSGPALDVENGALDVVWYHGGDGQSSLRHSRAALPSQALARVQELQGSVLDANHPRLAQTPLTRWLIFEGRAPDGASGFSRPRQPWVLELGADGRASSPVGLPMMGAGSSSYPALAGDSAGRLYAAWTEHETGTESVVLVRGRHRPERPKPDLLVSSRK